MDENGKRQTQLSLKLYYYGCSVAACKFPEKIQDESSMEIYRYMTKWSFTFQGTL